MQDFSKKVSGFYYDQQLGDYLLTARLYPNAILTSTTAGGGEDEVWSPPPHTDENNGETYFTTDTNNKKWWYSTTPIARAILNEEFNVSIANQWSDFGGDPLGQFWNSQKAMGPYMALAGKAFLEMAAQTEKYDFGRLNAEESTKNTIKSGITNILGSLGKSNIIQSKLLHRSLVVQGTQFTYFGGTGTDFGSLNMKYTVFADYFDDGLGGVEWRSVHRQLTGISDRDGKTREDTCLLDYVIGNYINFADPGGTVDKAATDSGVNISNEVRSSLNEFAQWQMAPGGYEAAIKSIDTIQKGTLKLEIGMFYSVANLVIQSVQLNFSKTMIKNPDAWSKGEYKLEPMACDVMVTLKPATKSSKNSLLEFINGNLQKRKREQYQRTIGEALKNTKAVVNQQMVSANQKTFSEAFTPTISKDDIAKFKFKNQLEK